MSLPFRFWFPRCLGAVSLALGLALSPAAHAQTDAELSRARQLFSQGVTQEAAADWAGALATFEEVARIKVTPQVRFHVARCKEQLGRWNEALGGYRLAEYEAARGGDKERSVVEESQKAREALEARMPKLTIERGQDADAIKIELDGVVLGDTQVGREIAVDPGPHVIVGVVGPGKTFKRTVTVAEGDAVRLKLDVPGELTSAAPAPRAPAPVDRDEPAPSAPVAADAPARGSSAAPWIVGGIGVAGLGAAVVFHLMRKDAEQELEDGCLGKICPDTLEDTQKRGETYAALSGVSLGIGLVGIGASALMLLGQGGEPSKPTTGRVTPGLVVTRGGGGVWAVGRF